MKVFLDTSAIYALGSESDEFHQQAEKKLMELIHKDAEVVTSNYVLLECTALLQNRQGVGIAREIIEKLCSGVDIIWLDDKLHNKAWKYWYKESKESLSLVDCSSFLLMEQEKINSAFTFDNHFAKVGFKIV